MAVLYILLVPVGFFSPWFKKVIVTASGCAKFDRLLWTFQLLGPKINRGYLLGISDAQLLPESHLKRGCSPECS